VSSVFSPVSTITKAVWRTLTLWRWRSAASSGAGVEFGELVDLAGANAAEKRTFSGKRVHACGAANDSFGRKFCTGHRYGSSQWSAHVKGSLRSTCLSGLPSSDSLRSAL